MSKYILNLLEIPNRIVGTARASTKSTWHGKKYEDMDQKERDAFRDLFLSHGANGVVFSPDSDFLYNIE